MAEPAGINTLSKPPAPAQLATTLPIPPTPRTPQQSLSTSPASTTEPASTKTLSMRGRKRHKCMVCGNIARSRCPFFSCKGCCVKAGNACHIHVLKASPSDENVQGSAAAQGSIAPAVVKHPYDNLRLRTLRPPGIITRKEAGTINSWRFRKLRSFMEGISAYEDDAFDRYMQNNLLLDELFNVSDSDTRYREQPLPLGTCSTYERSEGEIDTAMVSAILRARQRMSFKKREAHRQRLRRTIDRSLQKLLLKGEETDDFTENDEIYLGGFSARRELKRMKVQSAEGKERLRRMEVFASLLEKLKVVENQEDFDSCLKTYDENFACYGTDGSRKISEVLQFEGHAPAIKDTGKAGAHSTNAALNAFFKARLDSHGVRKEIWNANVSMHAIDSSSCILETL
ncbi:hypothetical protein KP509_29G052300 [Ceratopteris richardii]|uniref:Uncharacterized protein n=1 Tax=Ceratopteris richardii TaxID=49495 RepID=A0A8T2R874_CERRI|nr:hypothetical protein KP509_29G052300 [Ceratopteris richardii]